MELIVLRHGHAVDAGVDGVRTDAERYLTEEGRRMTKQVSKFLAGKFGNAERIYSSPLTRAVQTAAILRDVTGIRRSVVETEYLSPGGWNRGDGLLSVLEGRICAVVGHNPDLEELVSYCLAGAGNFVELKKAGACCISFDGPARRGGGLLKLLVAPSAVTK